MLKKILIAVTAVLVAFLLYVATSPATYRVERSREIAAPRSIVFSQISDFRAWARWSPWEKLDPNMKKTFAGDAGAVGSSYEWKGNDKVGSGKMTAVEVSPPSSFKMRLEFVEPFASVASNGFSLDEQGTKTKVTWWMEGENNFVGKMFGVFMDMDAMIGKDFEKGLNDLSALSEAEAKNAQAKLEAAPSPAPAQPADVPPAVP